MPAEGGSVLAACERRDGEVRIALADGEVLTVGPESVPADLPPVGGAVDADLRRRLREADERKRIARRLFALLDRRLHPPAVLRRKLAEEGFAAGQVDLVLERFAAQGLYSEARFATAWCRDAVRRRPCGRLYLLAGLRERGIDDGVAGRVVAEVLPPQAERELALAAARRRWRREPAAGRAAAARVQRYLLSRGFAAGLAADAARAVAPAEGEAE